MMSKPGHSLFGAERPSDIFCMQAVINTGIAHNYVLNIWHLKEVFKQELDQCVHIPSKFMLKSVCCQINTPSPLDGSTESSGHTFTNIIMYKVQNVQQTMTYK